jgi:hypothetical protein
MKPFNFWLFGGGVLYTGIVLSVIGYDALEDCLMHCVSCCYEMLL